MAQADLNAGIYKEQEKKRRNRSDRIKKLSERVTILAREIKMFYNNKEAMQHFAAAVPHCKEKILKKLIRILTQEQLIQLKSQMNLEIIKRKEK